MSRLPPCSPPTHIPLSRLPTGFSPNYAYFLFLSVPDGLGLNVCSSETEKYPRGTRQSQVGKMLALTSSAPLEVSVVWVRCEPWMGQGWRQAVTGLETPSCGASAKKR